MNVDGKSIDLKDDKGHSCPKINKDHLVHFLEEYPSKVPKLSDSFSVTVSSALPNPPAYTPAATTQPPVCAASTQPPVCASPSVCAASTQPPSVLLHQPPACLLPPSLLSVLLPQPPVCAATTQPPVCAATIQPAFQTNCPAKLCMLFCQHACTC